MKIFILIVLAVVLARVAWWWFVSRNRPEYPPLKIDEKDPLMIAAHRKARETTPQLLELFTDAKEFTRVKIPFVSNSGVTEHLWADLLSVEGSKINVRYLTPPVTHSGKLERLHTHDVSDIEDWVITKNPSNYIGGYTMRVMFQRGRELWGDLPPKLKKEESKYG